MPLLLTKKALLGSKMYFYYHLQQLYQLLMPRYHTSICEYV